MPESVKIPVQLLGIQGIAAEVARLQAQLEGQTKRALSRMESGAYTAYEVPKQKLYYPETKIPVMMETETGKALTLEQARRVREEVRKRVEASAIPTELKEDQIKRELASKYTTFAFEGRERRDRNLETRMFKINNDKIKLAEEELQKLRGMTFKSTSQEEQIRQQKIQALQQELDAVKARPKTDPTAIAAKKQQILGEIYPNDLERANQRRQQAQKRLFEAEEKLFSGYGILSVEEATNLRKRITHESRILQDPDYLNRTLERGRRKKLDRLQQELQVLESGGFFAGTKEEEENRRRKIENIRKTRGDLEKEGLAQTRRTESVKRAASASQGIEEYIKELEIEMAYAKERPKTGFLGLGSSSEDLRRQKEFVRLQGEINRVKGLKPAAGATYQDILQWKEEYNVAHREWFNFKRSMDVYDNLRREQDRRRSGMTMGLASAGIGLFGSAGFPLLNVAFASMSGMPYAGIAAIATGIGETVRALNRFSNALKEASEKLHFRPKEAAIEQARWDALISIPGAFLKAIEAKSTKESIEKLKGQGIPGERVGSYWEATKQQMWQELLDLYEGPLDYMGKRLREGGTAREIYRRAQGALAPKEQIDILEKSYESARRFLLGNYKATWSGAEETWKRIQAAAISPGDEEMRLRREQLKMMREDIDLRKKELQIQEKDLKQKEQDAQERRQNKERNFVPFL